MPIQNIQTGRQYFSAALSTIVDSTDMKIEPLSNLAKYKHPEAAFSDQISGPQDAIGLNQRFFYKIEHYEIYRGSRRLIRGENGVGEVTKKRKNFFLKRHFAIYSFDSDGHSKSRDGQVNHFSKDTDYIVLEPFIPKNYYDALTTPYSVLCSVEQSTPSPVELQEKTLLGRLDDVIQSIDHKELRKILNNSDDSVLKLTKKELDQVFSDLSTRVLSVLRDSKRAIATYSQKIDMLNRDSSVAAPIFQVKPEYSNSDRPPKPKQGMIIFNKETKSFEGYDGKSWKTLKME